MLRRLVPNMLTLGNMLLGVVAVLLCAQGHSRWAAIVIMLGMVVDGLDGRLARWLHVQSEYGKELDSLADIVTFGVAPAVVMYMTELRYFGLSGMVVTLLFPVAGALRLARFNVQPGSNRYFVGLPITAAGGIMAAFTLYRGLIPDVWMPAVSLLLSFLMVSRAHYPNFKRLAWPRTAYAAVPLIAALTALVFAHRRAVIPPLILAILTVYGISGTLFESRALWRRAVRRTAGDRDTLRDSGR